MLAGELCKAGPLAVEEEPDEPGIGQVCGDPGEHLPFGRPLAAIALDCLALGELLFELCLSRGEQFDPGLLGADRCGEILLDPELLIEACEAPLRLVVIS